MVKFTESRYKTLRSRQSFQRKGAKAMKIRDVMTDPAIRIGSSETVEVAARTLARYNIGALPVCGSDGRVCGMVTDRDLVTRCLASGHNPAQTRVEQVMSGNVVGVPADMEVGEAARLMARKQVRRLPVLEQGKLKGMVSLGDLSKGDLDPVEKARTLTKISSKILPEI